ncbi:PRC-barrel domain-containing protein [Halobacillus sp. Marseille-P3879]|uniref:PRC-barrel domain-containing protein n=1 Tax=Halobacillus sp. Marseille-P3879 TaxID=2045014 RepID=UPI000C7E1DC7|nr:PRC-barrel domain-containing protein [Halobacillus sp. Marseille-P3879]
MLMKATNLEKLTFEANDGEMGKVKNLYFNVKDYVIRYITVESAKWFPDQIIYISTSAIESIDFENKRIKVNHTKEELQKNASVKRESDMNADMEQKMAKMMNWNPRWWEKEENSSSSSYAHSPVDAKTGVSIADKTDKLISINEMKGIFNNANVMAGNEKMGNIADFIIEEQTWRIRYFLINSGNWSTHPYVLVSPDWISSIDWDNDKIYVDMTLDGIERGPIYKRGDEITRKFEEKLYKTYRKRPYWV